MDIVLVRHATCAQMDDVLLGRRVDPPLDWRGEGQARGVATRLLSFRELSIESSPRRRARHTAGIIAAPRDLPVRVVPELDEIDFGCWSGRSFATLANDRLWRRWNQYRGATFTPGGDSMRAVQERVMGHLLKLEQRSAMGTVVMVTHAEVIRCMALLAMQAPFEDYVRLEIRPASLTTLRMQGSQLQLDALNERAAA
jgi:broad specificity phosphatase PhoE